MPSKLYAYRSEDVHIQVWYGPEKESSLIIPCRRFIMDNDVGSEYSRGAFELSTMIFEGDKPGDIDIFESIDTSKNPIDIVVFPKKSVLQFIRCNDVIIYRKTVSGTLSGTVNTVYHFSTSPEEEEYNSIELPNIPFNPDPIYRIARAFESFNENELKRLNNVPCDNSDVHNDSDIWFTVEEYCDLIKNGNVPLRYQNIEDKIKCQYKN